MHPDTLDGWSDDLCSSLPLRWRRWGMPCSATVKESSPLTRFSPRSSNGCLAKTLRWSKFRRVRQASTRSLLVRDSSACVAQQRLCIPPTINRSHNCLLPQHHRSLFCPWFCLCLRHTRPTHVRAHRRSYIFHLGFHPNLRS